MSKKDTTAEQDGYKKTLRLLQIELVKLQKQVIATNEKILVIVEGRDAAGKDGVIKRIVQHLSPRETRVVALGKPSDRDCSACLLVESCVLDRESATTSELLR